MVLDRDKHMEDIILIDGIPHSEEIHEWFSKTNIDLFKETIDWDDEIKAFIHIMPKFKITKTRKKNLKNLTCAEFFEFLEKLQNIADGLSSKYAVPETVPYYEIKNDIAKIKKCLIYWCLIQDLDLEKFGAMPSFFMDNEFKRVDLKLHFKSFYMMNIIEQRLEYLDIIMSEFPEPIHKLKYVAMDYSKPDYKRRLNDIISMIRRTYKGDLEAFIEDTKSFIQNKTITDNHVKLAQLVRHMYTDFTDFKSEMPSFDAWRYLYTNYFTQYEDVFDEFLDEFTTQCIEYYFNDYLDCDFDILKIPFYYSFILKSNPHEVHKSIISIINIKDISDREKERYSFHD